MFWFIPRIPPTSAFIVEISIIVIAVAFLFIRKERIISGPSFCHVARIKHLVHDMDVITDGNQLWQGAIPSFIIRAVIIRAQVIGWVTGVHNEDDDIRIKLDPSA